MNRLIRFLKYDPNMLPFWKIASVPFAAIFRARYLMIQETSQISISSSSSIPSPCIFINWHMHLPYVMHYLGKTHRPYLLMSKAPYMETIAAWSRLSGLNIIRGGSDQGGENARNELIGTLRSGHSVMLAVDGPTGPAFRVKRGCIDLARVTGFPIVHVSYTCKQAKPNTRRWDLMLTPVLFDNIELCFSEPLYVREEDIVNEVIKVIESRWAPAREV